jgi:hypothetical protein
MSGNTMTRSVATAFALLVAAGAARAQGNPYLEALRTQVAAQKTEIMHEAMMLTEEQADVFWPIYNEFVAELSGVSELRYEMAQRYFDNQMSMTPQIADEIIKGFFAYEAKRAELLHTYFGKVSAALDAVVAARFIQAERHIQMLIDIQIANEVPLIGIGGGGGEEPPN